MVSESGLAESPLFDLTAKQREVLDLVIQHKTSKEISRLLGISPHTVDQRIMLARGKLGVGSRGEVAQAYRRLVEIYEQPVYEPSHIGIPSFQADRSEREDVEVAPSRTMNSPLALPASGIEGGVSVATPGRVDGPVYYHVLPEMFDGPHGTAMRLGYIAVITVFLILIVLGGLSMFAQLSSLLDR